MMQYRVTPEVPENIQNNLAHLELDAESPQKRRQEFPKQESSPQPPVSPLLPTPGVSEQNSTRSTPQPFSAPTVAVQDYEAMDTGVPNFGPPSADMPNFSPFPPIIPKPNVPPSDEEKEQILENARVPVLSSTDPEMQLAWGQDVLSYIQISQLFEERIQLIENPNAEGRPPSPVVQHQLRLDAMNIVNHLAEQGHPKALFLKGMWLEFGNFGYRQDKKESFRCYLRAANAEDHRAQYRMGMFFEQTQDPVKALIHYQRGAESGDSASNYRLGMMTLLGQMGQQQDFARGIQMLKRAAESADENAPQGAYVLGMLQARELPQISPPEVLLPYDEKSARINIEKAAYLGFAKAQLKMGAAYELCSMGCEFDPALSLHYNALAAKQGEAEAEMAISKWFLCGYEGVFKKNDELAFVYAERAAHSGLANAEFALGYFYEIGIHTKVSLEKAKEWYEKAAAQGNQDATARLESLKKDDTLSRDHEKAAIHRIRSQYGSKRGGRPDRLKAQAPDLPPIPSISDYEARNNAPRSNSTAPYPDQPPSRSSSTAPYPMNDGLPQVRGATPVGGFFNPNGPPPQQNRARRDGQGDYGQDNYNNSGRSSSASYNDPRRGSGGQPPGGQRMPSGPAGYGQPNRNDGYGQPGRQTTTSPRPGQGMQDIGFVAPLQVPPKQSPHQSPVYGSGPGGRPPQQGGRPPQGGPQQGGPGGQRPGPQRPGQAAGPPPAQQRPAGRGTGRIDGPVAGAGRGAGRGQAAQKPPAKPSASPAGLGPKTFEEMGIAAQQKDSDCVSSLAMQVLIVMLIVV
jgi:TPR repeat protein